MGPTRPIRASRTRSAAALLALLGAAAPVLLTVSLLTSCGGPPPEPPRPPELPPADVRVAEVTTGPAPRLVRATGSFAADQEVTVAAEVAGRLVAVLHDVGDQVRPGDVLARVDETDYAMECDQRRLAVTESLAKIGLDALPSGDVDFEVLPTVVKARLEAENAKARFDRAKVLQGRTPPLISDQDYDDARTTWEVAESGHRLALLQARAGLAEARTRQSMVAASEQRLHDCAHAVPEVTRAAADPFFSPEDVRKALYLVAARDVAAGDYVQVGKPLFRLVDADPLRLRLRVPERKMTGVVTGRPVSIDVAGAQGRVAGRVSRVRPEVDERTRTVDVEVVVQNPDMKLAVGAFATAEIDVGTDPAVPQIPPSAVRTFAGVRRVLMVKDGRIDERTVTLGRTHGERVEVVSGLTAGERFVTEPASELVSGRRVTVVESTPSPSQAPSQAPPQGDRR